MQKTKTIRKKDLAEFERYARPHMRSKTIQDFPNFSATGSIRGMKKMYYGENALLLRIGPFIYNVSSCPELWNFYKAVQTFKTQITPLMVSPWFDSRGGAKHTEMKNLIKGPRNAPSKNDQKALIKKLYKSGLFHTFKMGKNYISWIDSGGRIFSWQSGLFRSGFVFKYDELAPTYESEYNDLGLVERVCFVPDIEVRTDSVRYVHINAVNITLPNTL